MRDLQKSFKGCGALVDFLQRYAPSFARRSKGTLQSKTQQKTSLQMDETT